MVLSIVYRYKLRNIEETEAAKKLLQEKRLMGRTKTDSSIPSSYSADYFQRGKDYAEKLRRGLLLPFIFPLPQAITKLCTILHSFYFLQRN